MKTPLRRKESVGILDIHEIAPKDHIKPVKNLPRVLPLELLATVTLRFTLPPFSHILKAPLVAPEPKPMTLR